MGLLSGVLLLPLAPVRGVVWIADRLIDAAEAELYDPGVVRVQLAALNLALDRGEIDLPQFEREEERLLDLLERKPLRSLGDSYGPSGNSRMNRTEGAAEAKRTAGGTA
ncbi:gas vesicle protein GvpG [Streptomyces benahoarensis]|uniref:Gas vesicle protein n=1 Tax=Streptomyces benahoarensis TaxID=2595054 RepID=A0A553ZMS7_9ACTN|nr:gas vesicle protein GvpG [Streptomyces benahoarensis]TSB31115.1 gas vesicle protein [Streptomyces benahoarensis]TSB42616.1 gas vesicle protein [Streptomyces benahoarensis]